MGYQVSTPVFEGPLDLLLHLVSREQVDIWELSLASIVDQYIASLEHMQALDLSVATEFLLTAAVLLELKTRRLLSDGSEEEDEETLALWEERDLLLARLLECKTFKDASLSMNRLMDAAQLSVPRRAGLEERFLKLAPDPMEGVTAADLRQALVKLLTPKPLVRVNTEHVAPVRASVADTARGTGGQAAGRGAHHLQAPHRSTSPAAGNHRVLPGHPRAVQAGRGRPWPGRQARGAARQLARPGRQRAGRRGWDDRASRPIRGLIGNRGTPRHRSRPDGGRDAR